MCLPPTGASSAKAMLGLRLFLVLLANASCLASSSSSSSSTSTSLNSAVQLAPAGPSSARVPSITTTSSRGSRSRGGLVSALRNPDGRPGGNGGAGNLRSTVVAGFGSAVPYARRGGSSSTYSSRRRRIRRMMSGASSLRCVCAVPPPNISPLAWDIGVSTVVGAASVVWVKLWTTLAHHEKLKPQDRLGLGGENHTPRAWHGEMRLFGLVGWRLFAWRGVRFRQVSRKIVHTTAAPLFMVLWPFFTDRPCARFFAAAVPMMQAARLARAGRSGDPDNDDASTNALVKAISRSGRASETLEGPLKYSLAIVLITILEWRTSAVGIVAMLQMAVGDGMADLVGRKFGKHKWQKGGDKSIEGSAAFASGSFLASMVMIQWFHWFGMLPMKPAEAAAGAAVVSAACAAVELLPVRLVGDDNFSVPITALIVGRLLL
ncbi:unnamed protein product [Pylaiella littoralis]